MGQDVNQESVTGAKEKKNKEKRKKRATTEDRQHVVYKMYKQAFCRPYP